MKKLFLGLGLLGLGVACRASGANVHDSSSCTMKDCTECHASADCSSCSDEAKAECQKSDGAVCPVTGKSTK